jgi:hypothetical protein
MLDAARKRVFLLHDVHRPAPALLHSRWTLSYLRGPLTRDEIGRLMKEQGTAPAAAPARPAPAVSGAPVLPAPFRHSYFKKYGGELGHGHLLVKYAVRYKGSGETVALRAYPLAGETVVEALEADPLPIEESALTAEAPAGLRYEELPAYLAGGAKAVERALKDRLPDKLAVKAWFDPVTKTASQPREDAAAFASRLGAGGGGPAAEKLRERLEKKQRELASREQDLSGRKRETWMALGSAVLSNIGLFTGRKRTISGAGSVLSKNRMENAAGAKVEDLKAEIAALQAELAEHGQVDPARFEAREIVPARTDLTILRYDLVWVY